MIRSYVPEGKTYFLEQIILKPVSAFIFSVKFYAKATWMLIYLYRVPRGGHSVRAPQNWTLNGVIPGVKIYP